MSTDFYATLGVSRQAPLQEIKKAYRKLAMKHHPDRAGDNKASETRFKEVNQAYEVLSDKAKRATYDQYGADAFNGSAGGQGFRDVNDIFGDFFGDMFGGGARQRKGNDIESTVSITLEQAATGVQKDVSLRRNKPCDDCDGTGAEHGTAFSTCKQCNGQGQVRMSQGFFSVQQTCPACHGQGQVIDTPCRKCHGRGVQHEQKKLSVSVPKGVNNGVTIRLSGEGESVTGGISGDLFIHVQVKPHDFFQREDNDLICSTPISIIDAALGCELEVPTLSGKVKLKIPEGTQSHKIFRMRGKGMPGLRGGQGDLLCRIEIETPVNLSEKQRVMLRSFRDSINTTNAPHAESWLKKAKRFFDSV